MARIMKYSDYEKVAKVGDRIVLRGIKIVDGFKYASKCASLVVLAVGESYLTLLPYASKHPCRIADTHKDQEVAIFNNEEFDALKLR